MKVIKNKSTLLSLRTIVSWLFTIWHLLICFPLIQCYSVCIILHEQNMSVSLFPQIQQKQFLLNWRLPPKWFSGVLLQLICSRCYFGNVAWCKEHKKFTKKSDFSPPSTPIFCFGSRSRCWSLTLCCNSSTVYTIDVNPTDSEAGKSTFLLICNTYSRVQRNSVTEGQWACVLVLIPATLLDRLTIHCRPAHRHTSTPKTSSRPTMGGGQLETAQIIWLLLFQTH